MKTSALVVALAMLSPGANAAGLGRISVLSALGQPLKAEVDVSASRDEAATLTARLASAEAFRQQGIEYTAALASIRMTMEKRPSGQPFIRISSDRPLNEPFLDLLVELSWGSGRLVREYTFLLDPPAELSPKVVTTPVAPPEARTETRPAVAESAAPAETAPDKKPEAAEKPAAPEKTRTAAGEREVKRGDTLGKIAAEAKPEGVNLDQMLVALYQGNKDVFAGGNMNRLRAGKILRIPEREEIAAVDAAEARKVIVAQSADFNAYRRKLAEAVAAAPAKEEAPQQAAAGKITPKVEDKAPAAPAGKDKLEVSRTEAAKDAKGAAKTQSRVTALEEDLVARDRALKEASSRVAALEKNVGDLKKLAELKSQGGAQVQQQAQAGKPADAKKPEPAAPAKPVEAAKPADAAKPAEAPKPAEPPKVAEAPKPAEPPKPPAAKKPPPPPPPPEPSFMEENMPLVLGGGGVLAALLGFLGFSAMRKKRKAAAAPTPASAMTSSDLTANSVFGTTGGQAVDTGAALHTDFGQPVGGADEGVDPVAEADVYMAYGRDVQAEEILIEALKKEPTRHAIHLKLLEIYAARRAVKQFETLASDLKNQTGGSGADWSRAAEMGRTLDPANPLYGGASSAPAAQAPAPTAAQTAAATLASTVIMTADQPEKMQATVTMPGQLAHLAAAAEALPQPVEEAGSLDFDLDLGGPSEAPAAAPAAGGAVPPAAGEGTVLDFDLDLGAPAPAAEAAAAPAVEPASDLGLDFDLGSPAPEAPAAAPAAPAVADSGGLDFDFDIGMPAPAEPEAPAVPPPMDLSSISLDLGETPAAEPAESAADNPEVATKLELAQAYEEMGDKDGARELLQEVLNEGDAAQQETARARLAGLG